jgi:hypothetical protein
MHAPTERGLSSMPGRLRLCTTDCLLKRSFELRFRRLFWRICPVDAVSVRR